MRLDGVKKRTVLNSPRLEELKRKKRNVVKNKLLFFLLALLALLVILILISRIDKLNISVIQIEGNKVVDTSEIERVVMDNIAGHFLFVIPKSNFLLYSNKQIEEVVRNKFKRVKDISISLDNPQTLRLKVTERDIKYTYCGDSPFSKNENANEERDAEDKCYFMDEDGYIFDTAPYFSGAVYLKFFGPLDHESESPIGERFLKDNFTQVVSFIEILQGMELRPSSLLLREDGDLEVYLSNGVVTTETPKIIFKKDEDFTRIAENLQTAITADPLKGNLEKKFDELLYIDLRFGNKVYYKFK